VQEAQLDMFLETVDQRISAALDGHLFFFVREAAEILMLNDNQIRLAITMYRLDSLLIGNQYRIPRNALIRYQRERRFIRKQYLAYQALVDLLEKLRPDNVTLSSPMKEAFHSDCVNYSEEPAVQDWYDLWELPLPQEASVSTWARLLRIPSRLIEDLQLSASNTLRWPDIYDWMISREMINLPVGFEVVNKPSINGFSERCESPLQLVLFEEMNCEIRESKRDDGLVDIARSNQPPSKR